MWLPPLPDALTLDGLLGAMEHPDRGLQSTRVPLGTLALPYGIADVPDEQRKEVAIFDATHAGGHLLVVGAPQTGKTTLLRSLIAGAALTHTPAEVQVYALDLGGGGSTRWPACPMWARWPAATSPSGCRASSPSWPSCWSRRERLFAARGIDGLASFRARRAQGALPEEPHGDVLVVVDNWAVFRTEFEELADRLGELATRCASFGVHLVVAANRAMDLRLNLKDLFGNRSSCA